MNKGYIPKTARFCPVLIIDAAFRSLYLQDLRRLSRQEENFLKILTDAFYSAIQHFIFWTGDKGRFYPFFSHSACFLQSNR